MVHHWRSHHFGVGLPSWVVASIALYQWWFPFPTVCSPVAKVTTDYLRLGTTSSFLTRLPSAIYQGLLLGLFLTDWLVIYKAWNRPSICQWTGVYAFTTNLNSITLIRVFLQWDPLWLIDDGDGNASVLLLDNVERFSGVGLHFLWHLWIQVFSFLQACCK